MRMLEEQYDELIDREYEKHVDKILFPEFSEEDDEDGRKNSND